MEVSYILNIIEDDEKFSWFSSCLRENLTDTSIKDQGISPDRLVIGRRVEDGGYVIGYQNGSGSILDVGLVALWWCFGIKPFTEADLKILEGMGNLSSFEKISVR